jgi:imidazolonepropionase-like amidohydrolase
MPITIRAGTLLDGRGGISKDVVITIEGAKIASIGKKSGAVTYDLSRSTVTPGWIDTHVHVDWHLGKDGRYQPSGDTREEHARYAADHALTTLRAGFTTAQVSDPRLMSLSETQSQTARCPVRAF